MIVNLKTYGHTNKHKTTRKVKSLFFIFYFDILSIGEFMVNELYLDKIIKLEFLEVKILNRENRTFFFEN